MRLGKKRNMTQQYMNKKKVVNPLLDIKYWNYTDVLEVHEALQKSNESINKLGLVPVSL